MICPLIERRADTLTRHLEIAVTGTCQTLLSVWQVETLRLGVLTLMPGFNQAVLNFYFHVSVLTRLLLMACLFGEGEHRYFKSLKGIRRGWCMLVHSPAKSLRFAWFAGCYPRPWRRGTYLVKCRVGLYLCVGGQGYFQTRNTTKCLLHQEASQTVVGRKKKLWNCV